MAWDGIECIERNTWVTGYIVRYDPPTSDGIDETLASGDGYNGGSVTLIGLSPSTSYSIEVAGNSDQGHGPFSDPVIAVTESKFTCDIPALICLVNAAIIPRILNYLLQICLISAHYDICR